MAERKVQGATGPRVRRKERGGSLQNEGVGVVNPADQGKWNTLLANQGRRESVPGQQTGGGGVAVRGVADVARGRERVADERSVGGSRKRGMGRRSGIERGKRRGS